MADSIPNMSKTSLTLLQQLRESPEADAWDRLNRIYAPLIRKWLIKYDLQASDADDLAQEVMLAVNKDIQSFDHNGQAGAFRSWMKGILINRLRRRLRIRSAWHLRWKGEFCRQSRRERRPKDH